MLVAPMLAAAVPGIVSGIFGAGGQVAANRANRAEAERNRRFQAGQASEQMAFQERMRNTAWQSGVADMEAAGLNPALAYGQGPAASPGGASGSGSQAAAAQSVTSSAMQAMQMEKTLKLADQQISKTKQEARAAKAAADLGEGRAEYLMTREQSGFRDGSGMGLNIGPRRLEGLIAAEIDTARAGATNMSALGKRNDALARMAEPLAGLSDDLGKMLPVLSLLMAPGGPAAGVVRGVTGGIRNRLKNRAAAKAVRNLPVRRR